MLLHTTTVTAHSKAVFCTRVSLVGFCGFSTDRYICKCAGSTKMHQLWPSTRNLGDSAKTEGERNLNVKVGEGFVGKIAFR